MDLLIKNLGKDVGSWKRKKVPIAKEPEAESGSERSDNDQGAEPEVSAEAIKKAQRVVGELNWLVTRCRPDMMYTTSRMSSLSTKRPDEVVRMAEHAWKYLANTTQDGICFKTGGQLEITVYTDASFGQECQGCVVILWNDAPVLWKSSRQQLVTTSTAASELVEIMEGACMTEAVRVIIEELIGKAVVWQLTDSQSALAIVSGETASWRTRHLRKRAKYLRWKIGRGDVALRHVPGLTMVADLGTKPLSSARMEELKKLMGMYLVPMEPQKGEHGDRPAGGRREASVLPTGQHATNLQALLVMMALVKAAGSPLQEEWKSYSLEIYTAVIIALTTMVWWSLHLLWGKFERRASRERNEPRVNEVSVNDGPRSLGSGGGDVSEQSLADHEQELRPIFVSGKGMKYHLSRECPGLFHASKVHRIRLCSECRSEQFNENRRHLRQDFRGKVLFSLGVHNPFHEDPKHGEEMHGVGSTSRFKSYAPCIMCALSEQPEPVMGSRL